MTVGYLQIPTDCRVITLRELCGVCTVELLCLHFGTLQSLKSLRHPLIHHHAWQPLCIHVNGGCQGHRHKS